MRNLRKPYQMYVLNLDSGRIFWLTTLLLLLLSISFVAGLLIGKEQTRGKIDEISQQNKQVMDEIFSKLDEKKEDNEDFQFYELMSSDKTAKPYIPENKNEENDYSQDDNQDNVEKIIEKKNVPEVITKSRNYKSSSPVMNFGDDKLNVHRPFGLQVASYKEYKNAKTLQNYLISEQYPAYIIKSSVNGIMFYRVRVGPFASETLTLKVLDMVKNKKECGNSYIIRFK